MGIHPFRHALNSYSPDPVQEKLFRFLECQAQIQSFRVR